MVQERCEPVWIPDRYETREIRCRDAWGRTVIRHENVLVERVETLGPLARRAANEAEVHASLPAAHHFGHR